MSRMTEVTPAALYCRVLRAGGPGLAAAILFLLVPPSGAAPHSPILVDGPDDICARDQGIVNCDTADGTADAPYIIEEWEISTPTDCLPLCAPLPACPGNGMPSLIALCDVDAHFLIRSVAVDATAATGEVWQPSDGSAPEVWPGALAIRGKGTVRVEDSQLVSVGRAVHVVGLGESAVSLARVDVGGAGARVSSTLSPLVEADGARLTLEDSTIDATGRSVGLRARGTGAGSGGAMSVDATGLAVTGNVPLGLEFHFADVTISGSQVTSTALPASQASQRAGQPQAAIWARQGTLDLRGSQIATEAVAIHAEGTTGTVAFNTFASNRSQAVGLEAARSGDVPACGVAFNNNDMAGFSVENRDDSCTLDARSNWWGGDPVATGDVATSPALPFPAATLPRLKPGLPVLTEQSGEQATLQLIVAGAADEVRLLEGPGTGSWSASTGPWSTVLDLRSEPYGPVHIGAAACRAAFCGPLLDIDFEHEPQPVSPIAVLRASRLAAMPGEEVILSGSDSFSPHGTPIVSYRFGDGPWSPEPGLVWTMPDGQVEVAFSLAVRDAAGLESLNEATLTIHERAPLLGSDARQAVPAPGPAGPAVILLLAALLVRMR